jgi:hypothetical protein
MVHPGFLLAKISVPTYDSGGGAKQAHHLRFKQGDFDWEAWLAAEGKPFVPKVTMTGRTDAKQAHHLRFKQGDFDWEAWLAAEGKPFVLKVTMTGRTDTGTYVTEEMYDNWKVNQPPGNDAFRFTAPADVKQVKAFGKRS